MSLTQILKDIERKEIKKKVQKAIKENYYDVDLPYSWNLKDFEGKTIKILKFSTSLEGFPLIYFLCEGKIYRCFLIPNYPF
jgi:hypothetical protein